MTSYVVVLICAVLALLAVVSGCYVFMCFEQNKAFKGGLIVFTLSTVMCLSGMSLFQRNYYNGPDNTRVTTLAEVINTDAVYTPSRWVGSLSL